MEPPFASSAAIFLVIAFVVSVMLSAAAGFVVCVMLPTAAGIGAGTRRLRCLLRHTLDGSAS